MRDLYEALGIVQEWGIYPNLWQVQWRKEWFKPWHKLRYPVGTLFFCWASAWPCECRLLQHGPHLMICGDRSMFNSIATPKRCFDGSYGPKRCLRVVPYITAVITMHVCSMSNVCSMLHALVLVWFPCLEVQCRPAKGMAWTVFWGTSSKGLDNGLFLHPQNRVRTRWYSQSVRYVSISIPMSSCLYN